MVEALTLTCSCQYLGSVYGLLESFEKALIINDHASLYVRQARSALSLEGVADEEGSLGPLSTADLDEVDSHIKSQRDRLSKDWFAHVSDAERKPSGDLEEVGLSELSLQSKASEKKKPLVFDISYNYAVEADLARIGARARGEVQEEPKVAPTPVEPTPIEVDDTPAPKPSAPARKGIWGLFGR